MGTVKCIFSCIYFCENINIEKKNILLIKILNFVPKQKYFNKTKFFNEINGFYRRIKLKAHFKDQTNRPKTEKNIFRKPTDKTWKPQKHHHTTETFIEATNIEINEKIAHIKPPKYSNLSKGEQRALEDLEERDDIAIFNVNKGGVAVIMDVTDYIKRAETQLNNKEHYCQLSKDQTAATMKQSTML